MSILIIGKNSILCKLYLENTKLCNFKIYSRKEIQNINFHNFTHVINFSYNPALKKNKYNKNIDFDLKLSNIVCKYKIIYIFISTRFVYSGINSPFVEKIKKLKPKSNYGRNKLIIENKIKKVIPKKHLILRLSTMLYFNLNYQRKLFSYTMLSSLKKKKKIYFDFGENTYKDFIIPSYFAECLDKLILNKVTGIYNICSGLKIKVKTIAKKIISGFGNGKIIFYNKDNKNQSFSMSNKLIFKKVGILLSQKQIYDYCVKIGLGVKNE
jgi:dTDP-4-dehydrorhamnose reductase